GFSQVSANGTYLGLPEMSVETSPEEESGFAPNGVCKGEAVTQYLNWVCLLRHECLSMNHPLSARFRGSSLSRSEGARVGVRGRFLVHLAPDNSKTNGSDAHGIVSCDQCASLSLAASFKKSRERS